MPRFRSKPRTITANRFHADKAHDVPGVCRGGPNCTINAHSDPYAGTTANNMIVLKPHVHTMHDGQPVLLKDGDWVVPEPDGIHYYPIADEVIQTNYELIKETEQHAKSTN